MVFQILMLSFVFEAMEEFLQKKTKHKAMDQVGTFYVRLAASRDNLNINYFDFQ